MKKITGQLANPTVITLVISLHTHTHTHNHFTALFPGPPGWAGDRRELLDYGARED